MPKIDDLDILLAAPARPGASECNTCWALARLSDTDHAKMVQVLAREDIPASKIRSAFRTLIDFAPGDTSISRHNRGECA